MGVGVSQSELLLELSANALSGCGRKIVRMLNISCLNPNYQPAGTLDAVLSTNTDSTS